MPVYEVTARRRIRFWVNAPCLQQAKDAVHDCECIEGYADEEGSWQTEVYPVGAERPPRGCPRFGVSEGLLEPIEHCGRRAEDAGGGGAGAREENPDPKGEDLRP